MNLRNSLPDEISSRRRVLLALDHEPTDRVPMTFAYAGIERPVQEALARDLGLASSDDVYAHFDCYEDIALVGPSFRGIDPDYRGPTVWRSDAGYDDIWGCRWEPIDAGRPPYDISRQPLSEIGDAADLDRHPWPQLDWWDWDAIAERIAHARDGKDYALCMHSGNLWERAWWMRGFERSLYDMIDNPDLHHALMERITTVYLDVTKRILEIADGAIGLAFTADDIAGQDGLLLSLPMWEQNIKPYHVRLMDLIHDFGVKVVYHSDGNIMPAVAGLIDMGVDVLQALQFSARGMDPVALKDTYGDRLCFQGGISVQTTLPFGTVEDVRREVRDRIQVLGRGGGYILSPSHTIMPGTPPENVIAMLETAASTPVPAG
ncbi:MAG TPA: uroporphyrinogen decarboxylase family protein [Armatimonadota bacterium]|nr:uroporphyrinogen decarboxylase family protein [Armatimonadota bacterium]